MSTWVCEGASSKHLSGHVNEQSTGRCRMQLKSLCLFDMPPCEEATLQGMEVLVRGMSTSEVGHVNGCGHVNEQRHVNDRPRPLLKPNAQDSWACPCLLNTLLT